jgi:hypothetical protein
MNGMDEFFEQIKQADDPAEALIIDLYQALKSADRPGVKKIIAKLQGCLTYDEPLVFIKASDWLISKPPEPDQIIKDIIDIADKLAIIGSSKLRKSFFLLQLCISIAAGMTFLSWDIPFPRRVAYIQLEIKDHHFHRRLKNICQAMNILPDDLGGRLLILNGRGLNIIGPEGIDRILFAMETFCPEVIAFDPLYKIAQGVENAAEDVKVILNHFDQLAEQTGAAIIYVHHDAKGTPGDRDIRDRGAGSNVIGRDYDACIALTAHAQNTDAAVIDVLLRNYPPQESFAVEWSNQECGYCFRLADDILPEKKTSKTKPAPPALSTYLPIAESILGNDEMEVGPFKMAFKKQTALSDNRIRDFLSWATAGGNPHLLIRDERGRGIHKKWIIIGKPHNEK